MRLREGARSPRRGQARDAQLEAQEAAVQEHVAHRDGGKRDEEADFEPRARPAWIQRTVGELLRLREVEAFRSRHGSCTSHDKSSSRHGEHQAHESFVVLNRVRSSAGIAAHSIRRAPRREHEDEHEPRLLAVEGRRDAAGEDRAKDELALRADVPDVGTIAAGEPHPDQHQRGCLQQQLGHAVEVVDRVDEECVERLQRIPAECCEQDEAGDDGEPRRKQRRQPAHQSRRLGARFKLEPHGAPRQATWHLRRSPWRRATCRSSRRRSPRHWFRGSASPAKAGPSR